jgi:hypothetical protein
MAIGSGKSDLSLNRPSCKQLLLAVLAHDSLILAIDEHQLIEREYERHFGNDYASLGKQILSRYGAEGRLVRFAWGHANGFKKVRLALKKHRFHNDDIKFVRTAIATTSKRLVAEEKGYDARVCATLKKTALIIVLSSSEAVAGIV